MQAQGKRAQAASKFRFSKECLRCLQEMTRAGKKSVANKALLAKERGNEEGVFPLKQTNHGETRLENCEKYDLGDGCRLVGVFAGELGLFVYAGTHDDVEHWLETHKGHRWVIGEDKSVAYVPVATSVKVGIEQTVNLTSRPELADQPLLRTSDEEFRRIGLSQASIDLVRTVTPALLEDDDRAFAIVEEIQRRDGESVALLMINLFGCAKQERFDEIAPRIQLHLRERRLATPAEVVAAAAEPINSEQFVDFDDDDALESMGRMESWDDWMLFLHPDQRTFARKDFNGPARLRGVSGSGKTCVLVHRARYLAKKYQAKVRIITLTESTTRLIALMMDRLCGVERPNIQVTTVASLVRWCAHLANKVEGAKLPSGAELTPQQWDQVRDVAVQHPQFAGSIFQEMDRSEFGSFLRREIEYVRGRLEDDELDRYLDAKAFPRRGRVTKLGDPARAVVHAALLEYVRRMRELGLVDFNGITQRTLALIGKDRRLRVPFRCLLVDEVQDLTQHEVNLLARLELVEGVSINDTENGIFLAGDGAQAVYGRGFNLRQGGISIANRSAVLKRSYRNTHEILRAAYALIERYEFADMDDEDVGRPAEPSLSSQRGLPPQIVRCADVQAETWFVAQRVKQLIGIGVTAGQICVLGPSDARRRVAAQLERMQIGTAELREDADYRSDSVKVSTIESAKGHEFGTVIITGLNNGWLPASEETSKDAAKLYVGMTRARNNLIMTYHQRADPSIFLADIQPYCDELLWRDGKLIPIRD